MFDFDFDQNGLAFIVMERGGLDLEKALADKPFLPIHRQKILWKQMLNILITLHNNSLVCLMILFQFYSILFFYLGTFGFKTIKFSFFW